MVVAAQEAPELALDMRGIGMRFGEEWVLRGVDFAVRRGTIHALVGHNGAGKSTLMKIALGSQPPTEGSVRISGQPLTYSRPAESRQLGLGMVLQERSLIRTLSGLDNVFLNAERVHRVGIVDQGAEEREAAELCRRLGIRRSLLRRPVSELSPVQQQLIEIAKALRLAREVLILDEPTAPLTEREVDTLFRAMRNVAASGTGIVLITHHLGEVFAIADEVTTLREGVVTLAAATSSTTMPAVIEAMLGKQLLATERGIATALDAGDAGGSEDSAPPALEVRSLEVAPKLRGLDFEVRPGEILGVAGLAGSGRSTLLKTLFGDIRPTSGEIRLFGTPYDPAEPGDAIARNVYLIPEERARFGLVITTTITENTILSVMHRLVRGLFLRMREGRRITREMMRLLGVRARGPQQIVGELSGGNQQKVVLAKALAATSKVLLLDEPTFGVDVGAARDLIEHVRRMTAEGTAVIWVTSDLIELVDVADRIAILTGGTIARIVTRGDPAFEEAALVAAMQRVRSQEPPAQPALEASSA